MKKIASHQSVQRYLSRGQSRPVILAHDSVPSAYTQCGCHPDVVARLWDVIDLALPARSRCLVGGRPALVHPDSRIVLGLGIGTQYALRLPGTLFELAVERGCRTRTRWSDGSESDTQVELGIDWVYGAWQADELDWCARAFAVLSR